MAENETIGGIAVDIVGNYAPLQVAIEEAVNVAKAGGESIAEGLNSGANAADALGSAVAKVAGDFGSFESQIAALVESGSTLAEALAQVQVGTEGIAENVAKTGEAAQQAAQQLSLFDESIMVPYADAAGQLNLFAEAMEPIAPAAQNAAEGLTKYTYSAGDAGESSGHAKSEVGELANELLKIAGITLSIEALKEFAASCLELYADAERAGEAIAFMRGDVQQSEEPLTELKSLAQELSVPFDDVSRSAQQMAFRLKDVSFDEIANALRRASDAAKVSGGSFDSMAQTISRIALSGSVMPRTLTAIGVSMDDLARVMKVDVGDVKDAFKDLDEAARLDTIVAAMSGVAGATEAMRNDTKSQLTRMANDWQFAKVQIGGAIQPIVIEILPSLIEAMKSVASAAVYIVAGMQTVAQAVAASVSLVFQSIKTMSVAWYDLMTGNVTGAVSAVKTGIESVAAIAKSSFAQWTADMQKDAGAIDNIWKSTGEQAKKTFGKGAGAGAGAGGGDIPTALNDSVVAMKAFSAAALESVTATQIAAAQEEALAAKTTAQAAGWHSAQAELALMVARYKDHNATAVEVADALNNVNAKFKDVLASEQAIAKDLPNLGLDDLNKQLGALNPALEKNAEKWINLQIPVQQLNPAFADTQSILREMGITIDDSGQAVSRLISWYERLGSKQVTLDEENAAWERIGSSIQKIAKTDLPAALKLYDEHYAQLVKAGAAEGVLLETAAKRLQLEIQIDETTGASATHQIVGLEMIRLKQQALYDQTHLLGDMYVGVLNDLLKGWDSLGKSIADNIIDEKDWGKVALDMGKQVAKMILETLVGTAFKALKDSLVESTGLVDKLSQSFTKLLGGAGADSSTTINDTFGLFKSGKSAGGGSAASGLGGGGVLGAAGAIGSVASAISGIISNFQLSDLYGAMKAVALNTLGTANELKNLRQDAWDQQNGVVTTLGMIFDRLGDIWSAIVQYGVAGGGGDDSGSGASGGKGFNPPRFSGAPSAGAGSTGRLPPIPEPSQLPWNPYTGVGGQIWSGLTTSSPAQAQYAAASSDRGVSIANMTIAVNGSGSPMETARAIATQMKSLSSSFAPFSQ